MAMKLNEFYPLKVADLKRICVGLIGLLVAILALIPARLLGSMLGTAIYDGSGVDARVNAALIAGIASLSLWLLILWIVRSIILRMKH